MHVTITTGNINKLIAEQLLPPAAHINTLIQHLVTCAKQDDYSHCTIKIQPSLLAESYSAVPAMLGRSLKITITDYPWVQSFRMKGSKWITLFAGMEEQPTTFRRRAIRALSLKGEFRAKKIRIPQTYKNYPRAFARILTKETGKEVECDAVGKMMRWFAL